MSYIGNAQSFRVEGNVPGNLTVSGNATISGTTNSVGNLTENSNNVVNVADTGTITAGMLDGGQSGSAPALAVRAFVSINGGGSGSGMINNSANVSSITDNGVGNYTVNFTTSMPSSSYSATTANSTLSAASRNIVAGSRDHTASNCVVQVETSDGDAIDTNPISCTVVA